jgi:D-alanine-D-alanine ligase-like ATP-grasp enzyme
MFTKPANAGSSVGVRKVTAATGLEDAVRHALQFDGKAVAEQGIASREIELTVLGGSPPVVSVAGEIITLPGFTAISMYPKLWALSGVSQTELVSRLIDLGLARARERAAIRASYGA